MLNQHLAIARVLTLMAREARSRRVTAALRYQRWRGARQPRPRVDLDAETVRLDAIVAKRRPPLTLAHDVMRAGQMKGGRL